MEISWKTFKEFMAPDIYKAGITIIIFSALIAVNTLLYDPITFSCRSGSWHHLVLLNFRGCMTDVIYSILNALQWFFSTIGAYFVSCALCSIASLFKQK